MKELYKKRKETIERFFETAKEYHNLRYSREKEKFRMEEKFGLTLVYLNFKKLVKWIANIPLFFSKSDFGIEYYVVKKIFSKGKKINLQI